MKNRIFIIGMVLAIIIGVAYAATTWYIAGEPNSGVTATQAQSIAALAKSATWTTDMWRVLATLAGTAADSAKVDSLLDIPATVIANAEERSLQAYISNLNNVDTVFVVSPWTGVVTAGYTVISGNIATADQKLLISVPGSSSSWDDSVTIAYSGSTTGTLDTISTFTETGDTVLVGQAIRIKSDGACTNGVDTVTCVVTLKLRLY